jgi:Glycosyltransferase Family 4
MAERARATRRYRGLVQPGSAEVRVLHAIDSLRLGGAEALLAALIAELPRQGVASFVAAASRRGASPELVSAIERDADGLQLIDGRRLYDPRIAAGLVRMARLHRVELIHSHLTHANVSSRLVSAALRLPHVTTIHTLAGPPPKTTGPASSPMDCRRDCREW